MRTDQILKELEINTGVFPRQAVVEAMARQEEITPYLLDILRWSTENIERLERRSDRISHLYAMFLLAYFREPRAYPLIVDFFSVPGEISVDVTGDFVTEDLPRVLASVSQGDGSLMLSLAKNEQADEYVRSAALRGFLAHVAQGLQSREEAVEIYRRLFRSELERKPGHVWSALVDCSCDLHPDDLIEEINQAFDDSLVDSDFVDLEFVKEIQGQGKTGVLQKLKDNPHHRLVGDVVKEMEWWACFERPVEPKPPIPRPRRVHTKRRSGPKIGRNDPCPCGSGRKYKHCCGQP
jgi:hypothetical protein